MLASALYLFAQQFLKGRGLTAEAKTADDERISAEKSSKLMTIFVKEAKANSELTVIVNDYLMDPRAAIYSSAEAAVYMKGQDVYKAARNGWRSSLCELNCHTRRVTLLALPHGLCVCAIGRQRQQPCTFRPLPPIVLCNRD